MIVVPPPPPPSSSAASATVAGVLSLGDAPASLRGAPLGAIIQGTVASNAPGALVVQTAQGPLTLPVNLAGLKVGQQVTLTLQPGAGGAQILIQPDRPPAPGSNAVADLLPNLQGAAQPARAGAVVQAVVIRATSGAPGSGAEAVPNASVQLTGAAPVPSAGGQPPPVASNAPAISPAVNPALSPTVNPTVSPQGIPAAGQAATPLGSPTGLQAAPVVPGTPPTSSQSVSTPAALNVPLPSGSTAAPTTAPQLGATAAPANPATLVGAPTNAAANASPVANSAAATPPQTPVSAAPASAPTAATAGAIQPQPAATPSATLSTSAIPAAEAPALPPPDAITPALLRSAANGERVPLRVIATLPAGIPSNLSQAAAVVAPAAGTTAAPPAAAAAVPAAANAAEALLAPGNFPVVVVGASANGSAIVRAGGALLTLEGVSAPVNSALVLGPAAARGQSAPPARLDNAALAATLPGVAELITAANAAGGPAQAAMQAILPRLGPQMAAGMVFFMRALRTGDLGDWLGKDARTSIERSGRSSSVKKASADLERVARSNEKSEWSAYPIPVGVGGQRVEPVRLYVHQAEEDGENASAKRGQEKPTRFLIDLNLSRLGRIQIDGLARLPKLDLVLRSEAPLNPGLQQPLQRLFADVTSARGIQGEMAFQVAPPIDPTVASPKKTRAGIMV